MADALLLRKKVAECDVLYDIRAVYFFRNHDNSVFLERVLYETVESSHLRHEKAFSLMLFSSLFSKSIHTFNKIEKKPQKTSS